MKLHSIAGAQILMKGVCNLAIFTNITPSSVLFAVSILVRFSVIGTYSSPSCTHASTPQSTLSNMLPFGKRISVSRELQVFWIFAARYPSVKDLSAGEPVGNRISCKLTLRIFIPVGRDSATSSNFGHILRTLHASGFRSALIFKKSRHAYFSRLPFPETVHREDRDVTLMFYQKTLSWVGHNSCHLVCKFNVHCPCGSFLLSLCGHPYSFVRVEIPPNQPVCQMVPKPSCFPLPVLLKTRVPLYLTFGHLF
jgi:hypothetical protein